MAYCLGIDFSNGYLLYWKKKVCLLMDNQKLIKMLKVKKSIVSYALMLKISVLLIVKYL